MASSRDVSSLRTPPAVRALRLVAAAGAVALATACGADGSGPAEEVDRLTIAVPVDVGPINLFAQHEEALTELVYDKLLAPSPYVDEPQPWLAEEVVMRDELTWSVTLRDDVAWHDGEPFTADDVAFTIAYFTEAPTGRWTHHVNEVPHIADVVVTGPHTLELTCAYPCPELGPVTLADLPIVARHDWEGVEDPATRSDLPVGTGPYRLTAHDPVEGYTFAAHTDHFAGAPQVAELRMPIIPDPTAAFTALTTGEVDAVMRPVTPELLDRLRATDGIEVVATAPLAFPELRLNYERPPFTDETVRRAVSLAVDRAELLEVVALGQGRPATTGYPHPDSPWTAPDLATPTDPAEAARLLDEAGLLDRDGDGVREHPDGTPVAFTVVAAANEPTHVRAAQLVAEHLAAVGLDVTPEQLEAGAVGSLNRSRDFDAYIATITAHGTADPTQFIMSQRSGYLWNSPELPWPAMDELIARWQASTTIEERTELSFAMQRLFNTAPTAIPLWYPDEHWAYRPAAFDGWVESPGYGIVHKWSLLPPEVAEAAAAVVAAPGGGG